MNKFKLIKLCKVIDSIQFYRIVALTDFSDVKEGEVGGFVQFEKNLSQYGTCWIYDNARVYGNAIVFGNAKIYDSVEVFGNAMVHDNATVMDKVIICDSATVFGNARVSDTCVVCRHGTVSGNALVSGNEIIKGTDYIHGCVAVSKDTDLKTDLKLLDPKTSKLNKEIVDSVALHPDFIAELAKVAQVSVEKGYVPFNWLFKDSETRVSTLLAAHARHLRLAKKGINNNTEVKLDGSEIKIYANHLVYAAYNLLMANQIIKELPTNDDRLFKDGELK